MYDLDNLSNATNVGDMMYLMNSTIGGYIAIPIIMFVFLAIFIGFVGAGYDFKNVLLYDCFITAIISILFWNMGMIPMSIILYPIIGMGVMIVIIIMSQAQ
jgi:hypothetical protein